MISLAHTEFITKIGDYALRPLPEAVDWDPRDDAQAS